MKTKFSASKNQMNFKLTDQDLMEIHEIEKTNQTYGSQILDKYHELTREEIIENIKLCALNPSMKDVLLVRIGMLMGYDEQRMVKERVVAKKNDLIERQKEQEELKNQYQEEGELL